MIMRRCRITGAETVFAPDNSTYAPFSPGLNTRIFGTVVEMGEGAAEKWGIQKGDKVIAEQIYPCERCRFCQRGQYWMCEVHDMYGFQKHCNGAWAQFMISPRPSTPSAAKARTPDNFPRRPRSRAARKNPT